MDASSLLSQRAEPSTTWFKLLTVAALVSTDAATTGPGHGCDT